MKIAVSIFLLVVGLVLLGVGYSAPSRLQSSYQERYWKDTHNASEPSVLELQHYEIKGEIQYCTGWLMIAAAGVVFVLGRDEKIVPPTA